MTDQTPTCEQVRLLNGTPTRIRHGHGIDEPCPFGPRPDSRVLPDDTVCACLDETGERKVRLYERCLRCGAFMADTGPRPDSGIDAAYRERNAVVAALIRSNGYRAEVVMAPDTEGWFIVYADTPAGQVSWHISPYDMDLFSDWPVAFGSHHSPWDGHDTDEKYRRVARLATPRTETPKAGDGRWRTNGDGSPCWCYRELGHTKECADLYARWLSTPRTETSE